MSADPFILLPIGIAILLTGVLAVVSWLFSLRSGQDVTERLETYAYIPDSAPRREGRHIRSRVVRMSLRLNTMLSMFATEELSLRLASANWPITETEYILIRIWSAVFGFVLGWIHDTVRLLAAWWSAGLLGSFLVNDIREFRLKPGARPFPESRS